MSLDSQPLRGVIAGLGVMGSHHLRVLGSMPDAEVLGVADPDPDRRAAAARAHPGVETHATLEDALDAHTPDFACLAVPVRSLPAAAHAALTAGANVLVEKHTAATEDEAAELLQAVAAVGWWRAWVTWSASIPRWSRSRTNWIGALSAASSRCTHAGSARFRPETRRSAWRSTSQPTTSTSCAI